MKAKTVLQEKAIVENDGVYQLFERAFAHVKKGNIIVLHKPTK